MSKQCKTLITIFSFSSLENDKVISKKNRIMRIGDLIVHSEPHQGTLVVMEIPDA